MEATVAYTRRECTEYSVGAALSVVWLTVATLVFLLSSFRAAGEGTVISVEKSVDTSVETPVDSTL
jgi:hypothetical protein